MLQSIERNDAIRTVVVTGVGSGAFSAGSDVREFPSLMERGTVVEDKLSLENEVFDRWARLPQPTIAAIAGVALGGGAEFSLCCDYRVICANGRIGFPEIKLGTIPGSGGLSRLPRLVGGGGRALGLFLGGHAIQAEDALAIGLVDEISDPIVASTVLLHWLRSGRSRAGPCRSRD